VTAIGDDFDLFEPLNGIDLHFHRTGQSTIFENTYEGTARHQRLLGLARPLEEEHLAELEPRIADDGIVFYCPIAREIKAPLRHLKPKGLCGLAPQGFFRNWDGEGRVHPAFWDDAESQLAGVDILCLSATDPPSLPRFLERALELVPIVTVTVGELGARVYMDGRCFKVPAFPRPVIDPTGAGDVFAAGLLVGLRQGMSPLDGAQFACCAASFAVEQKGVAGVPPSLEAVEERLDTYRSLFTPEEISP
jgi:hypothetical protein